MMKYYLQVSILLFIFSGCEEIEKSENSSWNLIQEQILAPNCANCHITGTAIYKQSGLDLSGGNAYNEMVNVLPKNISAKDDELVIVSTAGGMKGLSKSFLWEKINAYDREHFLSDHSEYGQMMPPGENFLTDGQLQFVRSWIEGGAPETGIIVDEKILTDSNRYKPAPFKPLPQPKEGFQLHLGPFEVQPNFEREFFHYTNMNLTADMYVNRVEIEMRPGSHHFILYSFLNETAPSDLPNYDEDRELRLNSGGLIMSTLRTMQYHQFFAGTQWPRLDYKMPPGVALRLPSKFGLDQNSHYVNRTDSTMIGEVFTNIHTVSESAIQHVAELFSMSNQELSLPPKKVTTLQKTFRVKENTRFGQVFSHAHEKMKEFIVEIDGGPRDGEVIYWTDDWKHPPILNFDPPIEITNGQGLKLIATYDNPTDYTVRFGFASTDEMMILFGWYYK